VKRRIVLAGGGTAGHIEPALAVADAISNLPGEWELEFLGTSAGLESKLIPRRGYRLLQISKVTLPRKFSVTVTAFPLRYLRVVLQTRKLLSGAAAVIGFGGYVSAAAYLAAKISGIPILIHESNAKPGWANRLGRRFARVVAVNFTNVKKIWPESILTGIPIRKEISDVPKISRDQRSNFAKNYGLDPDLPIVAFFGGSQGSSTINRAVAEYLAAKRLENIQIIHALGPGNPLPTKTTRYLPLPYFEDMASIYSIADLLITRSGAVTCAELISTGKFAVLVPLPHGNGEQYENAAELVAAGNAILVRDDEFSGTWLIANLAKTLSNMPTDLSPNTLNLEAANQIARLVNDRLIETSRG
jgi:UDP-N-acetylglucosamine--N-acetylmuramyl-(pentapeptide) pyrophosphoryl-undecaprenol N-acetylglucosamine transferase